MSKITKDNTRVIGEVLKNWGDVMKDKCPTKDDGEHIDVYEMNKMEETKEVVITLKHLGITSGEELYKLGFVAAGMLLSFKE